MTQPTVSRHWRKKYSGFNHTRSTSPCYKPTHACNTQ